MFPNPAVDNIYVHGINAGTRLQLTNANGSTVYQASAKTSDVNIPANKLLPGVYFLQMTYNNTTLKTVNIIKK